VDAYARVRSNVRAVAAHQGRRHAGEPTSVTRTRDAPILPRLLSQLQSAVSWQLK
jgi:hypothetical protein